MSLPVAAQLRCRQLGSMQQGQDRRKVQLCPKRWNAVLVFLVVLLLPPVDQLVKVSDKILGQILDLCLALGDLEDNPILDPFMRQSFSSC